ncbi:MAG: MBL fold metallo-hydrolase [Candidatus Binatia bacterium]|nr:MBL fold metallo-hydrolase [Candidatus Binatia bacterium]
MTQSTLYLRQLELGPMENFVYIVGDRATRKVALVDPAWDIDAIVAELEEHELDPVAILITHFHPDHLGGNLFGHHIAGAAEFLQRNYPLKVYLHKAEVDYAQRIAGLSSSDLVPTEGGDTLQVGNVNIRFLHTPGHTPGSQCFLVENSLISGDTLFIGSCGRVDLPGSDPAQMYDSLVNKLAALPEETILYPGHNYASERSSTIGKEKRSNLYLRFQRLEDFLRFMGYA